MSLGTREHAHTHESSANPLQIHSPLPYFHGDTIVIFWFCRPFYMPPEAFSVILLELVWFSWLFFLILLFKVLGLKVHCSHFYPHSVLNSAHGNLFQLLYVMSPLFSNFLIVWNILSFPQIFITIRHACALIPYIWSTFDLYTEGSSSHLSPIHHIFFLSRWLKTANGHSFLYPIIFSKLHVNYYPNIATNNKSSKVYISLRVTFPFNCIPISQKFSTCG